MMTTLARRWTQGLLDQFQKRSMIFQMAWERAGVREHNLGAKEVMLGTAHWDDSKTCALIIMPLKTRKDGMQAPGKYRPVSGDTVLQFRNEWALSNFINTLQRLEAEHKERVASSAAPPEAAERRGDVNS